MKREIQKFFAFSDGMMATGALQTLFYATPEVNLDRTKTENLYNYNHNSKIHVILRIVTHNSIISPLTL